MKLAKYSPKLKKLRLVLVRKVKGESMTPTLTAGQIVLASGLKTPKVNSLVIVSHHGLEKVKRLSKISKNEVYILGDNSSSSSDSQDFGWLPKDSIVATVIWPFYQQKK